MPEAKSIQSTHILLLVRRSQGSEGRGLLILLQTCKMSLTRACCAELGRSQGLLGFSQKRQSWCFLFKQDHLSTKNNRCNTGNVAEPINSQWYSVEGKLCTTKQGEKNRVERETKMGRGRESERVTESGREKDNSLTDIRHKKFSLWNSKEREFY
jgi:hypothetical protein